jgi:hypothetical protein
MNSDLYLGKYVSQNAFSYTFFSKRNLEAIRKLHITLQWVRNKFEYKDKKSLRK